VFKRVAGRSVATPPPPHQLLTAVAAPYSGAGSAGRRPCTAGARSGARYAAGTGSRDTLKCVPASGRRGTSGRGGRGPEAEVVGAARERAGARERRSTSRSGFACFGLPWFDCNYLKISQLKCTK
jgi:hypothetical protein